MKYLFCSLFLFLLSCSGKPTIEYRGTACVILNDQRNAYSSELTESNQKIDSMAFIMMGQKGPSSRYENEDVEDEIEAISDLVSDMKDKQSRIIRNRYCTNVDQFYMAGDFDNLGVWITIDQVDSATAVKLDSIKQATLMVGK